MLLRGKRQGHAEVVVWNQLKAKQVWDVYVLSKAKQLKWIESMRSLKDLGLETQVHGKLIKITGTLVRPHHWQVFRKLCQEIEQQNDLTLINQVTAKPILKSNVLAAVYQYFFYQNADDIDCRWNKNGPWIQCLVSEEIIARPRMKQLIKDLQKKYFVRIQSVLSFKKITNYKLTFYLYKLEQRSNLKSDMTLEHASGKLGQLNQKYLIQLTQQDDFVLGQARFKISSIANPEIIIRQDKKFSLQIGSEIPYQSQAKEKITTIFRFAGLKISGLLKSATIGRELEYTVEISSPSKAGSISGHKKSSSVLLRNKEEMIAFSLNYQQHAIEKKSLPLLGSIPILGILFSDTTLVKEQKTILGKVVLERM